MRRRGLIGGVLALALWGGGLAGPPAGGTRLRGRAPPTASRRLLYHGDDYGFVDDDYVDDGYICREPDRADLQGRRLGGPI